MGRPIVYCGICGKSLRDEDFSKGKAHLVDNAPFCTTCRILPEPLTKPAPPPPPPAVPKPAGGASKSLPSSTPRRPEPVVQVESSSTGMVIGIVVALIAVILLIVIMMSSGGSSAPPPAPSPPPRAPGSSGAPPSGPGEEKALAAIRDLEALALSSSDPEPVLDRCQEVRPLLRGTPYLSRLDAVEGRAIEARNVRSRDRQLAMTLENVQKMREFDKTFERRAEIENMLQAAIPISGARKAEVEKILEEYRKAADAFAAKPPVPPPPSRPPTPAPAPSPAARMGPYDLDPHGFIRHWLILGPFGNRRVRDGFLDHDLLRTEADHLPAAGVQVETRENTKVAWMPVVVESGGSVLFRSLEPLGLAKRAADPAVVFAACWLNVEKECQVKLWMMVDDGCVVWLDRQRIWKVYGGPGLKPPEEAQNVTLTPGPHLLLLKLGTPGGGEFGFRLRIATLPGVRPPGIRVWTQVPEAPKILFSENFNQGRGAFSAGEVVPGGVEGTTALSLPRAGSAISNKLPRPAGPTWTVRFKAKPLRDLTQLELILWAGRANSNYWYHLRGLKKDEWNLVEVKAAQINKDWNGRGANFEGEVAHALRFYYDDKVPDGSVLIDDVEVIE